MKIDLDAFLRRANTHHVANSGIVAVGVAALTHIAAHLVTPDAITHVAAIPASLAVQIVASDLDALTAPLFTTGAIAAYFGRPATVPSKPTAETMEVISKSPSATAKVEAIAAKASAPASPVGADVPRPSTAIAAAMLAHVLPAVAGGRALTMTLFQDLQIGEQILGDLAAFASGKAVTQTGKIGSLNYTAEVQVLPNGPSGTEFQVLSGGPLALMGIAFGDVAAFEAGQPIKIAEKLGNTWYGTSFSAVPAPKIAA